MDKILRFFPHILIFSYLIRLLITGASLGDALVMFVFGSLLGGHSYLEHAKEPPANTDIKERLLKLEESHESVKGKVSSMTIAKTLR
jgi:hypothetical protein